MPSKDKMSVVVSSTAVPLVSFSNGTIKSSRKRKLTLSAFKDKGANKKRKVLIAESHKTTYKGDNFGPLSMTSQNSQLYVAEVNKVTGVMTMHPAETFMLHPVTEASHKESLQVDSMSLREKMDQLTTAFGSGKQKKALKRRKENKMADESITSAMGTAIDAAVIDQQAQPAVTSPGGVSVIPPYNKDAQSPADVYRLCDILGMMEMESVKNAALEFKDCNSEKLKEWSDKKEYPSSVLSRLQLLPMEEERRLERACLLTYLYYMLSLYLLKAHDMRKKDPLPQSWPDMVKKMMLDRFTLNMDGQKRCMPARLKDLLLSHILVLCLMVDNFTSPLAQLQKDLKLSTKKLQMHSRALGCQVKSQSVKDSAGIKSTSYIAILKVPLTFPEPARAKKARN